MFNIHISCYLFIFSVYMNKTIILDKGSATNIETNIESSEIDCQNKMLVLPSTSKSIFIYQTSQLNLMNVIIVIYFNIFSK